MALRSDYTDRCQRLRIVVFGEAAVFPSIHKGARKPSKESLHHERERKREDISAGNDPGNGPLRSLGAPSQILPETYNLWSENLQKQGSAVLMCMRYSYHQKNITITAIHCERDQRYTKCFLVPSRHPKVFSPNTDPRKHIAGEYTGFASSRDLRCAKYTI